MTKPKHTPGPWMVGKRGSITTTGHEIAQIIDDNWGEWRNADDGGESEFQANAHLIAAAPDMYEAALPFEELIQLLIDDCDNDKPFICTQEPTGKAVTITPAQCRAFLAALAKARGEKE